MTTFKLNGRDVTTRGPDDTPLLWTIRDEIGLTGTKFGCGIAQCGACTVHVDGAATRSCQLPLESAVGTKIVTIEGLGGKVGDAVRTAWQQLQVVQCGYCQSGQMMAAAALLAGNASPSDGHINDQLTNICRCCTYPRIRAAVHHAAELARA